MIDFANLSKHVEFASILRCFFCVCVFPSRTSELLLDFLCSSLSYRIYCFFFVVIQAQSDVELYVTHSVLLYIGTNSNRFVNVFLHRAAESARRRRQTAARKQREPGLPSVCSPPGETDRRLSVNQLAGLEQVLRLHV